MELSLHPAFLQLFSLGIIWILLHCAPMCGPIVAGLKLESSMGNSCLGGLIMYQSGRALVYASLGAVSGSFGSHLLFKKPQVGWLLVLLLLVFAFKEAFPNKIQFQFPKLLMGFWGSLIGKLKGPFRPFLLGILLAFLPCMLMFWALGLAATTGSPFLGALVMLLLVFLTSLPLYVSVKGGHILGKFFKGKAAGFVLLVSASWCALMTAASSDLIGHFHFHFYAFGKKYMIMFW
jgi:sulfite exporter TauE/SafE